VLRSVGAVLRAAGAPGRSDARIGAAGVPRVGHLELAHRLADGRALLGGQKGQERPRAVDGHARLLGVPLLGIARQAEPAGAEVHQGHGGLEQHVLDAHAAHLLLHRRLHLLVGWLGGLAHVATSWAA